MGNTCITFRMCNSAAKLYMEAERCFVIGDHERSYVLFGKYFKTILPLKKRDDYRRQKTELDAILGPQSKQLRAIEIMTELRDNLVDRYDKMKTKPTVAAPTENPLPLGQDNDRIRTDCKTRSLKRAIFIIIINPSCSFQVDQILFRPPPRPAQQRYPPN